MKFSVRRDTMLDAFQLVGTIVPSRPLRPILSHARLVVREDGRATLEATDLEIAMRYDLSLDKVDDSGEAVLPVARVAAILRECVTETVTFEAQESGKLRIVSGHSRFDLLSEDPGDFPEIPEFTDDEAFGLERSKFVDLIRKTQFAIAKEKSRFAFNGAKLQIEPNAARMVATDGKRLVMKVTEIDNSDKVEAATIVPARALSVFEKLMTDDDDVVRIALDDKQIKMRTTRAQISSRLVEGNFPNFEAVIPKETAINVSFDRLQLLTAFKQAALLTSQETRSVKFTLEDGFARLSAQALDAGEAKIELDAPDYQGEAFTISLNPDFIVEGLKAFQTDTVTFGLSRTNAPATMRGDEGMVYVVMPVTMRNG